MSGRILFTLVRMLAIPLVSMILLACTNQSEYFRYFEAEKVLVEFIDEPQNPSQSVAIELQGDSKTDAFSRYYRLVSSDTFGNTSEFTIEFDNKKRYRIFISRNDDGDDPAWTVTVKELGH